MGLFTSSGLNTVPSSSEQTTISPYAQPYVTDLLGKGMAFTGAETPVYTGQLTAGASDYQTQAWKGLSGLTLPTALTTAGTNLQNISAQAQQLRHTPTTFTDTYQAPEAYQTTQFANQYQAPAAFTPSQIANQYRSPQAYQAREVTTGMFTPEAAQQYMNPYIQAALDPQLREARRQAEITAAQNAAKMAQSGAFGGSRQAMVEAELQRNLGRQMADITGQGYAQAFQQAGQQFQADQARALQAEQMNVQQAQFAAQQGMQDAELMARYGMTAAQANEASRQFAAQQAAQAAQLQAQYGLSAQQATEMSRQYGYGQRMSAAQQEAQFEAQRQQQEQAARQFASTYGLQGLQAATSAQQAAANAAAQQAQYGLANLQALSKAGAEQQGLSQAALNAQYNEFLRQQKYPAEMLKLQRDLITGLPMTTKETFTPKQTIAQQLAGGVAGASGIIRDLKAIGMPIDQIGSYIKKMFGGTGEGKLTEEQIQAELDRASGQYYGPPADATNRGDGTYETVDNGIRTIYDADGNVVGMESADEGYSYDYGYDNAEGDWWG